MTGNTISRNGTGLAVVREPFVEAHDNCLAGNSQYGMYFNCNRTVVPATANWWGSDSGPFYRWRNPAGTGDEVYQFGAKPSDVNGVLVDSWLMTPNCAIELVGDCDGDDQVTAGDLAQGINIALATEDVGWCAPMDASNDGRVTVDELVTAANAVSADTATAPE